MKRKLKYKDWTLIPWDGNPELGYKCYRKSFKRGHVSVGVGKFTTICYSYGADSENSMSSTRWRKDGNITEEQTMKMIDVAKGKYNQDTRSHFEEILKDVIE